MPSASVAGAAGRFQAHGYFPEADWLWRRIPSNPVLDPNSATWAGYFGVSDGVSGHKHVCDIIEFGVAARGPGGSAGSAITSTTPRAAITFRQATGGGGDDWGPAPFTDTMPWPADLVVPGITSPGTTPTNNPPYDGHVTIADPTTGRVYNLWRALDGTPKTAWWGRRVPLYGDGREGGAAQQGSSTGARLARYGGIIRASEMTAAAAAGYTGLDHALFFSTNIASPEVRYPASVGDGANGSGVATPIPEGARVQLDPTIDVDSI